MLVIWKVVVIALIIAVLIIFIGAIGYRYILGKEWDDSLYLAALTMSSLSLEAKPETQMAKLFVAIYTLISIGFYLILIAALIACFLEPMIIKSNQLHWN
jgi:hypothetical protein